MRRVGIAFNENGYIKEWNLGNTAEIIPRLNGGNTTQYKCDYNAVGLVPRSNMLIMGGRANKSSESGLGYFCSDSTFTDVRNYYGFRTSCIIK